MLTPALGFGFFQSSVVLLGVMESLVRVLLVFYSIHFANQAWSS